MTIVVDAPSKWDIIPVHASDRSNFKACRRRWYLGSPAGRNLVRKANIHGINENLWFGTGIHYALERFYNPVLSDDPVASWIEWYELQVNGGIIYSGDLAQFADRNPLPHPTLDGVFVVDGLSDILPNPGDIDFEYFKDLGIGMMQFYKNYSSEHDNFTVLDVEHDFSVPIPDPEKSDSVLWSLDTRQPPDGYDNNDFLHPFNRVKPVHARGRIDLIVQDNDTGQYGIMDHKTAGKVDDDYFRHLPLDDQVTTYVWAAQQEAHMYDLPYKKIDFVIYQALRKCYPKPPTPLKNGKPSINRQTESTTPEMFEQYIKANGLMKEFEFNDSWQNYYSYLVEQGDKVFIQRDVIHRNKHQVAELGRRLYYEAVDMLTILDKPERHYPNPRKDYSCLNCPFRSPCEAKEMGYDYEGMLEDGYISNYDR